MGRGGARLGQSSPDEQPDGRGREHQCGEHRAPAEAGGQEATQHRRQCVGRDRDHRDLRQRARHAIDRVAVAQDRTRDDDAGGGAERLDAAPGDQPVQVLREQAHQRAAHHDAEPAQHRLAAAEAVRDRSPGEDAERETDQRDGERRLHVRDARTEVLAYGRQRREVEVGRNRSERGDRCQQDQQRPVRYLRRQASMPPTQTYLSSV